MRKTLRITALLTALLMLAALSGCKKEKHSDEGPEKGGETVLNEAETARVIKIAAAFRLFGECDIEKGLELRRVERMVFCMYTGALEPSDTEGYGIVSQDEADKMLAELFNGFDPKGLFRTRYKEGADQEFYLANGWYLVKLTDLSAYSYEVTSANELMDKDGERIGVTVTVLVSNGGKPDFLIRLELFDSETAVYSIRKCSFEYLD